MLICALTSCEKEEIKAPDPLTPPPVRQASAQERASRLPLLKYIPQESSFVLGVYHWPDIKIDCEKSHLFQACLDEKLIRDELQSESVEEALNAETEIDITELMTGDAVDNSQKTLPVADSVAQVNSPSEEVVVKNVVIAGNADWPTMVRGIAVSLKEMKGGDLDEIFSVEEVVAPGLYMKVLDQIVLALFEAFTWNNQAKSPALLAVVEMEPKALEEQVKKVSSIAKEYLATEKIPYFEFVSQKVHGIQFDGIRVIGSKLASCKGKLRSDIGERLGKELAKRDLYVVWGSNKNDNTAIVAICSDPQTQLMFPATVEQSIVNHPDFSFVDAHLESHPLMIGWMDKTLAHECLNLCKTHLEDASARALKAAQIAVNEKKISPKQASLYCQNIQNLKHAECQILDMFDASQSITFHCWQDEQKILGEIFSGCFRGFDWTQSATSMGNLLDMPDPIVAAVVSTSPECKNMLVKYWECANEKTKIDKIMLGNSSQFDFSTIKEQLVDIWAKSYIGLHPVQGFVADMKGIAPAGFLGLPEESESQIRIPRIVAASGVLDMAPVQTACYETFETLISCQKEMIPLSQGGDSLHINETDINDVSVKTWGNPKTDNDWSSALIEEEPYMLLGSSTPFLLDVYGRILQPDVINVEPTVYGPLGMAIKTYIAPCSQFFESMNQFIELSGNVDESNLIKWRTTADRLAVFSQDVTSIAITVSQENGKMATRFAIEKNLQK